MARKRKYPFLTKREERRFTATERAAYWKKKYLDLLKEMKGWV